MLFHEIYGCYFSCIAKALKLAVRDELDQKRLREIIRTHAFRESSAVIEQSMREGSWALIDSRYATPLVDEPSMPVTTLEKRWMKALLQDPRIALFGVTGAGLEDVEPLFTPDMFIVYDRCADGDPYGDAGYRARFAVILQAFSEKRMLRAVYRLRNGSIAEWKLRPITLEYSAKDDKFRLCAACGDMRRTLNLARLEDCGLLEAWDPDAPLPPEPEKEVLVLELRDEKNALERAMRHFSDLRKETLRIGDDRYRLNVFYSKEDEAEMLIRVLSFGCHLRVIAPHSLLSRLRYLVGGADSQQLPR